MAPRPDAGATAPPAGPLGLPCPKCRKGLIIEGRRGFGCARYREGCDFVVWREVAGKRLTDRQIADLIRVGRTRPLQGFRDPSGHTYAARLELGPECRTVLRRVGTSAPAAQGDAD